MDIPGINEAHTSKKYKTYVEKNWDTFDCVMVVMDGRQGVNTEEQVSLLHFVKTNLKERKHIPVMILCNKIDDPDDKEQMEMILEAQYEVEKIFGVEDRQKSLEEVLEESATKRSVESSERKKKTQKALKEVSPVFIPISGITAFVFQNCSNMSLETFRNFDEDLIAKLGRERIGKRKWKRLSKEEQIRQAHEAVSDPEGYQEGIEDSNFDKVLSAFSYLLGGAIAQENMIQKQIQVSLSKMSCRPGIVDALETSYKLIVALSGTPLLYQQQVKDLKASFWRLCNDWESRCFSNMDSWKASEEFALMAKELKKYHEFASSVGWEDDAGMSTAFLKKIIQQAFEAIKASEGFVDNISVVYNEMKVFPLDGQESTIVAALKECFDKLYQELEEEKLELFSGSDSVHHLSPLAEELVKYAELAKGANWDSEVSEVCKKFKNLVLLQICKVCEVAWEAWSKSEPVYRRRTVSFDDLYHMDWKTIISSILLLRYERQFCMDFGREIVWMEHLVNIQPKSPEQTKTPEQSIIACPYCSSQLTFNRFCRRCCCPVISERICLQQGCSGRMDPYVENQYRCNMCFSLHIFGGSDPNAAKHYCPDCDDEVLNFNRQCGNCRVFFYPQSENDPVCPFHKTKPDSRTGKCGSCNLVMRKFPNRLDVRACPKLKYSPDGLVLEDERLQQAQLVIPASLSDPNHFGHLAWRYCECKKSQN